MVWAFKDESEFWTGKEACLARMVLPDGRGLEAFIKVDDVLPPRTEMRLVGSGKNYVRTRSGWRQWKVGVDRPTRKQRAAMVAKFKVSVGLNPRVRA